MTICAIIKWMEQTVNMHICIRTNQMSQIIWWCHESLFWTIVLISSKLVQVQWRMTFSHDIIYCKYIFTQKRDLSPITLSILSFFHPSTNSKNRFSAINNDVHWKHMVEKNMSKLQHIASVNPDQWDKFVLVTSCLHQSARVSISIPVLSTVFGEYIHPMHCPLSILFAHFSNVSRTCFDKLATICTSDTDCYVTRFKVQRISDISLVILWMWMSVQEFIYSKFKSFTIFHHMWSWLLHIMHYNLIRLNDFSCMDMSGYVSFGGNTRLDIPQRYVTESYLLINTLR